MGQKLVWGIQIRNRVKFRTLEASTADPIGRSPKVDAVCTLWDQNQLQKKNLEDLDELFFSFHPTLRIKVLGESLHFIKFRK